MANTPSIGTAAPQSLFVRIRRVARRARLGRKLTAALALAVLAAGIATYAVLTRSHALGSVASPAVVALLALDVVLLLLVGALVAFRMVRVWIERRSGAAGSRLRVRLVLMFSLVAVAPAIVVAVLSALLIQFGIEGLFASRVSTAIQEA